MCPGDLIDNPLPTYSSTQASCITHTGLWLCHRAASAPMSLSEKVRARYDTPRHATQRNDTQRTTRHQDKTRRGNTCATRRGWGRRADRARPGRDRGAPRRRPAETRRDEVRPRPCTWAFRLLHDNRRSLAYGASCSLHPRLDMQNLIDWTVLYFV